MSPVNNNSNDFWTYNLFFYFSSLSYYDSSASICLLLKYCSVLDIFFLLPLDFRERWTRLCIIEVRILSNAVFSLNRIFS